MVLAGEYSKVMHASLAVRERESGMTGKRLVVTAYCGAPILRKAGVF